MQKLHLMRLGLAGALLLGSARAEDPNSNPFKGLWNISKEVCSAANTASSVGASVPFLGQYIPQAALGRIREFCDMVPMLDSTSQNLLSGDWQSVFNMAMNSWMMPYLSSLKLPELPGQLVQDFAKGRDAVAKTIGEVGKSAHDQYLDWGRFSDEAMVAIAANPSLKGTLEVNAERFSEAAQGGAQAAYNAQLSTQAAQGSVKTSEQLSKSALSAVQPGGLAASLDSRAQQALSTREETELIVNALSQLIRQDAMQGSGVGQQLAALSTQNALTSAQLSTLIATEQSERMDDAQTVVYEMEQQIDQARDAAAEAKSAAQSVKKTFRAVFGGQ